MLMLHCEEGNYTQVRQLLDGQAMDFDVDFTEANNESGFTPLAMAIKHHHIEIAEYLIERGANVNSVNKVSNPRVACNLDPLIHPIQRIL